jgi:CDP-glycerol glycerophosphotransferase
VSMVRELIKYSKHPDKIFPRLWDKLLFPLNCLFARIWIRFRGREALRQGRCIFLFGGFGGRRYEDNSAAIFEHMLANHPEIDSYWVIRKDCFLGRQTSRKIPDESRVVFKESFRANLLALIADAYIYSHGRYDITDYAPSETPLVLNIMLDHGFTALKRTTMTRLPSGKAVAEAAIALDLIAASSAREAEIHNREWGIPREKIAITGLPRHDRLYALAKKAQEKRGSILFMPTWREWNSRSISLSRTGFFRQIEEFLVESTLAGYLDRRGIRIQFYVHMWMREFFEEFRKRFSLQAVEVLDQETDLQEVLVNSSLLVTDYSSICWDFLLLDKPVLFYQFDRDEYIQHTGSYINLEKDLFGPVARTASEAASWVRYFVESGFSTVSFLRKMEEMKNFAFAFQDGRNCERVAGAIIGLRLGNSKEALR